MSHGERRVAAIAAGAAALVLILVSGAVAAVVDTGSATRPSRPVAQTVAAVTMPTIVEGTPVTPLVFTTRTYRHRAPLRLVAPADGISAVALTAYRHAAALAHAQDPSCGIPWQLVAAIGYIESDDGQIAGDSVDAHGDEAFPVVGIALDGSAGVARIVDHRGHFVRAQGPLQFIPSTWAHWRTDANSDGQQGPQNIFDASAAAARYLCSSGRYLGVLANQPAAITLYNDSPIYVKNVMNVERAYLAGLSAATVTLIPMPTCPPAKDGKPGKPTKACPAKSKKKAKKKHHATVVAARPAPAPTPTPTRTVTTAVAPKPAPTPTPTPTPTAQTSTPTPSP